MKSYIIRTTISKGKGIFANKDIKNGQKIFHTDLTKSKKYTLKQIANNPMLDKEHSNYIGKGKYVIEHTPASYMNHSCSPNCYIKLKTIAISDVYAIRNIKNGEELTHDYQATAIDQFGGKGFWTLNCECSSKNCRKKITGDFFKLPKGLQKKCYKNLPPSIKRKYKDKLNKLKR